MIFKQTPLYRFLEMCINEEGNKVLDCGAGGNNPPLGMFYKQGFKTSGIELDRDQLSKALLFANMRNLFLNIQEGNMTKLPYEDESFDFVYSYNTIFHMKKADIKLAVKEMKRVLKPNGLMFVNFLSVDDDDCGSGTDLSNNQYEQMEHGKVIHSYFEYDEADIMFDDMTFIFKERRILERIYEGERITQGYIDYIYRK